MYTSWSLNITFWLIIFKIVLAVTNVFEKILKFTIILGIPSKILGLIVGLIEGYILGFIIMFFFSGPMFGGITDTSNLKDKMLNNTPILTSVVKEMNDTIIDIYNLKDKKNDPDELEIEITKVMLKHKLINYDYIIKLKDTGKINIDEKTIEEYK